MTSVDDLYKEADQLKDEGKLEEAVAKLNDLLAQDGNYVLAHLALAVILGRLNRHEDAVKHGERACEIDPNDAFNFTAMSVTYQRAWAGTQQQDYIRLAEEAMEKSRIIESR